MRLVYILLLIVLVIAAVAIITVPIVLVCCQNENDAVLVTTNSGQLMGKNINTNISDFIAFFGVPYAKPPIGGLRFKPPEPVVPWTFTLDATVEGPLCVQSTSTRHSEDCLTINIYTNNIYERNRPVLVWIHGGALEFGSGSLAIYGPHYLVQKNIIVVTVQFRLGIMGFLNLGIKDAPGNVGLRDVILALEWIKENIKYFGGNPHAVTLSGQSSGSIMAHALLLSPMAQGLFSKVILQSGTALSYRFYHNDATLVVPKIKEQINAVATTNDEILDYLKTLSTSELLRIQAGIKSNYMEGYAQYYPFAITIEDTYEGQDSFLNRHPLDIMRDTDYSSVPMLIGFNSDEGIRLEVFMDILDEVNANFYIVVPTDLFDIDDRSPAKMEMADRIKRFYFGEQSLSRDSFPKYAELCTDSWYGHIADYVVRLQNTMGYESPTYYYVFAIDGAYNLKINDGITSPGPSHSDELGYIWKMESLAHLSANDNFSDLTRERMVMLWSNFVKYGNPTPDETELLPVQWEPVDYPRVKYLLINQTLSLQESPMRERLKFWQDLYGYDEI